MSPWWASGQKETRKEKWRYLNFICKFYQRVHACSVMYNSLQPHGLWPPGFSINGIFQARIQERVAISSSRGSSWPRDWTCVSYVSCTGSGFFTTSTTWSKLILKTLFPTFSLPSSETWPCSLTSEEWVAAVSGEGFPLLIKGGLHGWHHSHPFFLLLHSQSDPHSETKIIKCVLNQQSMFASAVNLWADMG